MPKEITHWLVSLKTAETLRGTLLGDAALGNENALKLGAIYPDILYHLLLHPAKSRYEGVARSFHGRGGEDTYDLLRQIIAALGRHPYRRQLMAFLLGVSTHLQTDSVFHPLVYYLTGNYEDTDLSRRRRAVRQHRRFESLMDCYFCGGSQQVARYTLQAIMKHLEPPLPQLLDMALPCSRGQEPLPDMKAVTMQALNNMERLQRWYHHRTVARVLYMVAPLLPGIAGDLGALFYSPQLDRFIPRVSGALMYRNPVTSDRHSATISDLFEEAVQQSASLARKIEAALSADAMGGFPERGPSLSYGFVANNPGRATYFAEKPFFDE